MTRRAGFIALVLLAANAGASTRPAATFWAHEFTESVGMNTHLRHARSFYDVHFDLVKQRLLAARTLGRAHERR